MFPSADLLESAWKYNVGGEKSDCFIDPGHQCKDSQGTVPSMAALKKCLGSAQIGLKKVLTEVKLRR